MESNAANLSASLAALKRAQIQAVRHWPLPGKLTAVNTGGRGFVTSRQVTHEDTTFTSLQGLSVPLKIIAEDKRNYFTEGESEKIAALCYRKNYLPSGGN